MLIAGGYNSGSFLSGAELYDPADNSWSAAGMMAARRLYHTATLMPSGKVLVVGGNNETMSLSSTELYDPASNTWSAAGTMAAARSFHTATLLPSGNVLVAGGANGSSYLAGELYDPASNSWSTVGAMAIGRDGHTATLLPSGKVLVAGGANFGVSLSSAELFDPGLAPDATRQPDLISVSPYLGQTSQLAASAYGSGYDVFGQTVATGFWPALTASGGANNESTSNLPVFQVQRIDNGLMRFIPNDASVDFTDTAFTGSATAFAGFPAGPVQVRVWVNGVPSVLLYTTLAAVPGQIAAPTAIGGTTQATVNFAAPGDNGGAELTYSAISVPGDVQGQCSAPCSSIVVAPLPAGNYRFVISAQNIAGTGALSPLSNQVTVYPDDTIFHDGFEVVP